MNTAPACPQCTLENTYSDGINFICADCGYEWPMQGETMVDEDATDVVKDANGNVLQDGDTVALIKNLKLKGSSTVIKVGTKVRNIRLASGDHNLDCKVDGIGAIGLKSEFVKKV